MHVTPFTLHRTVYQFPMLQTFKVNIFFSSLDVCIAETLRKYCNNLQMGIHMCVYM